MKLTSTSETIDELLSKNSFYKIPRYQRKYVWETKQLEELYDDLFNLENKIEHFMGCLVLEETEKRKSREYKIIDGQQRMTTFMLIFGAISKKYLELGETKKANEQKMYIYGTIEGEENHKLIVEDSYLPAILDFCFTEEKTSNLDYILKNSGAVKDKYNDKIKSAYLYFYDNFSKALSSMKTKPNKISHISDWEQKLKSINVIQITVPFDKYDKTLGYKVFEVLNARGIPLEQHELIKNYIFKYVPNKQKGADSAQKLWSQLVNNLVNEKTDNLSLYFNHYVSHKFKKPSKRENELNIIKENNDKNSILNLLYDIVEKSKYYQYICYPEIYKLDFPQEYDVYNSLKYFKEMNIRQVRPLILSIFSIFSKEMISEQIFRDLIVYLEKFYFRYSTICNKLTNAIDNMIYSLSLDFERNYGTEVLEKFFSNIKKYDVTREEFISNFSQKGYSNKNPKYKNSSNKKMVDYIFNTIENYYDSGKEFELKNFSIEHIKQDDDKDDISSLIGNLLPLNSKKNGNLGDSPFASKLIQYNKVNNLVVKKYVENYGNLTEWQDENINIRTKKIAELSCDKIWSLNR